MNPFEFVKTGGPYGDESCTYDIKLLRNITLKEFVNIVVSDTKEWGYICLGSFLSKKRIEYRWGEILSNTLPSESLNKEIESVTSNGGWSRMDYYIKLKS